MVVTRSRKRKRIISIQKEESTDFAAKKKINSWRSSAPKKKRKKKKRKKSATKSDNIVRWETKSYMNADADTDSNIWTPSESDIQVAAEETNTTVKRYSLRSRKKKKKVKAKNAVVKEEDDEPFNFSCRTRRAVEADPDVTFLEYLPKKKQTSQTYAPKKSKRKRKKHKIEFRKLLDQVHPNCEFEVHSASAQFYACFFHAVCQRRINFAELRKYVQECCALIDEREDIFEIDYLCTKQRRKKIVSQLQEWLQLTEFKENYLPKRLWSPLPLVLAMAVLLKKDIVVVSHIRDKSSKNSHSLASQTTIIAERYGANGTIRTVNDHNYVELGPLYKQDKLRLLYWPRSNAGHWSYVQVIPHS